MNILQLLASSSFITLNKNLIKLFGLEQAAIIGTFASVHNFNEALCEKKGIEFDGWFYKTYDDIEEELGLSKHVAGKAIENLIKNKILIDKKKGVPCLRYFKFQEGEIFNSLKLKNLTPRNQKNELQGDENFNDKELNDSTASDENIKSQEGENFNRNKNTSKNTPKNTNTDLVLPKEVDKNLWNDFLEMRNSIKSKPTENAKKLIIRELEKFISLGLDPNESLKSSIKNNWKDVYEPKAKLPVSAKNAPVEKEDKELTEKMSKIKFVFGKDSALLYQSELFKSESGFVLKVKNEKALKFQEALENINVKIEIKN